ncbi:hypothetical protein IW261DRAFT_1509635 [Armillaria novae-zelandiae]|uniref:Secreted protein n=1 Tax=Armillaria novae-zelandiae TaxID=153914 RepID=A0AA39NUU8_9AGAR|nr:hypothetical protein IW261DRAFT_1509635 [Armillaria novae-zelandiae]
MWLYSIHFEPRARVGHARCCLVILCLNSCVSSGGFGQWTTMQLKVRSRRTCRGSATPNFNWRETVAACLTLSC